MPYDEFYTKRRPPVADRAMRQRLADAREHWRAPLAQGFNQALEFKHAPAEAERALAAATRALEDLVALCADRRVPLLVALLPTKVDVDTEDEEDGIARMLELLDLPREDYAINAELGARLGRAVAAAGARVLDLAPAMAADERPLYWRQDHHLAVMGHRAVATMLLPVLEEMLGQPP
jgi:hypothetical protein